MSKPVIGAVLGGALAFALAWPLPLMAQTPAPAQTREIPESAMMDRLFTAIHLTDFLSVMIEEDINFSNELRAEFLPEIGPARWEKSVRAGLSPAVLQSVFAAGVSAGLSAGGAGARNGRARRYDMAQIVALAADPLMVRASALEVATRRMLLDPEVETAALEAAARAEHSPRMRAIGDYMAALDLVENNVAGSLNANLIFYRELAQGGAFPEDLGAPDLVSPEILGEITGEADTMRVEIGQQLEANLFMAYAPLSEAEFAQLSQMTQSAAGRALLQATNAGYDAVFQYNSKILARMIVGHLLGEDL